MAAEAFKLEIVTPTGMALARDVLELGAPTLDGEIGVLPGHVPLLAALRTGLVNVRPAGSSAGDEPQRFAIAHGVLEVANEKALVLTEKFVKKEDVDVVRVRARLKEVDDELLGWTGEIEDPKRIELIEEEQWLATQLELIGDPPQATLRELTRFKTHEVEEVVQEEGASDGEPPAATGTGAEH
jgi:F-type H+-transporting ATPase subunit epsilon